MNSYVTQPKNVRYKEILSVKGDKEPQRPNLRIKDSNHGPTSYGEDVFS